MGTLNDGVYLAEEDLLHENQSAFPNALLPVQIHGTPDCDWTARWARHHHGDGQDNKYSHNVTVKAVKEPGRRGLLCAGDTLEVRQYERLLPLKPEKAALGSLEGVRKGDCLVAFSRREVHASKRALESWGALKCCVVYGALPAEARTQQVRTMARTVSEVPLASLVW